jgi:hypothetical protein
MNLTEAQEVALLYDTERQNAARPQHPLPGATVPPLLTAAEVLERHVAQHLEMISAQMQGTLDPLMAMLDQVSSAGRQALIDALPRESLKRAVMLRLRQL